MRTLGVDVGSGGGVNAEAVGSGGMTIVAGPWYAELGGPWVGAADGEADADATGFGEPCGAGDCDACASVHFDCSRLSASAFVPVGRSAAAEGAKEVAIIASATITASGERMVTGLRCR